MSKESPAVSMSLADTAEDFQFISVVRSHPETVRYLHDQRAFSVVDVEQFVMSHPGYYWMVRNAQGQLVGYVRREIDHQNRSAKIGCDIHPDFRRQGYGKAAMLATMERLSHLCDRIWLEVLLDNVAGIALYQKLGFRYEGIKRDAVLVRLESGEDAARDSMIMAYSRQRNLVVQNLKVIAAWFGPRRGYPHDATEALPMLDFILHHECSIDPGCRHDTLIVVPTCDDVDPNYLADYNKCLEIVSTIDGSPNKSGGKISVMVRPNVGLSFGSFADAYRNFAMGYEYFFFTEDDQIVIRPGVFGRAIQQLEANPRIGFVATVGVSYRPQHRKHAYGGCGVASGRILNKVCEISGGQLPHAGDDAVPGYRDHEIKGEVEFTGKITDLGYDIALLDLPSSSISWGECPPYPYKSR